jgi:hypothetical protein
MTAGASGLQSDVFKGLGSLNFPSQLGQSFSSTGAYQLPNMGPNANQPMGGAGGAYPANAPGIDPEMPQLNQLDPSVSHPNMPTGSGTLGTAQTGMPPQGIASQYMNPYLQSVLTPQLDELRRQNDITNMGANAKLTQAGAFGGGRQAIMNAENNRNLMMEQNKTVGQGYANAYDKAMGQFNTEQGQARDLANLMSSQGAQQRDIEQQGISADYNEFLAQRDDPMKKTQYLQSMLQGLPISTVSNQAAQQSGIGQLASTVGGMGNIMESLKKLGL